MLVLIHERVSETRRGRLPNGTILLIRQKGLPIRADQETHRVSPPGTRPRPCRIIRTSTTKASARPGGCESARLGAGRAVAGGLGARPQGVASARCGKGDGICQHDRASRNAPQRPSPGRIRKRMARSTRPRRGCLQPRIRRSVTAQPPPVSLPVQFLTTRLIRIAILLISKAWASVPPCAPARTPRQASHRTSLSRPGNRASWRGHPAPQP